MVSLARNNLLAEKTKLFVSIGGVAFSILLIIFLMGVYAAFDSLSTAYILETDADLVVAQEGVNDMFHTFSELSTDKVNQIEQVSGGQAYGLISRATNAMITESDGSKIIDYPGRSAKDNLNGEKETINIIGYDTNSDTGGPFEMIAGSNEPKHNEIIVDRVFSQKTNLGIGDQIEVFNTVLTIAGIADKNNMMVYTRAFMNVDDAQEIVGDRSAVNFVFLKLPNPAEATVVANKLESTIPGISAFTQQEFADSNAKMIQDSFLPIILVITFIGFITGVTVVGLTVYTATLEKLPEYGVLKAIGASNSYLFMIVFEQALWSSITGYLIGVVLSLVTKSLATKFVPVISVNITSEIYLIALLAALGMSFIASYIPIRRISHLDPAMVFRKM